MKSVLIVDGDSTIPNLACMRLSSYHKSIGDNVSFRRLGLSYYPSKKNRRHFIDSNNFDIVYCSVIFTGTKDYIHGDDIIYGGTGHDLTTVLDSEVEQCELDYSLYPDNDTSYGFISRGCSRKCYFCVVPQKEGKTKEVSSIDDIVKHPRVKFMDNNFLSLPNHIELLEELIDKNIKCQFNQGLDFRLLTEENSNLLSKLNYDGDYIFAFDDYKYKNYMDKQIELLDWRKDWQMKFYVYVNPKMKCQDTVKRVEWLRDHKCLPYVMRDRACWKSKYSQFYTDLAAYANQPAFFKKMTFDNFLVKRNGRNSSRVAFHSALYLGVFEFADDEVMTGQQELI